MTERMREESIRPLDIFNEYLRLSGEDVDTFFADRSGFVEVPCPACGAEGDAGGFEKLGFRYRLCPGCSSLYVSPRPVPEVLNEYYRHGKAVQYWTTHFYKQTADARREKIFRPRAALVADLIARRGNGHGNTLADIGAGYGIFLEEVRNLGKFEAIRAIEPGPDLATVCRDGIRASGARVLAGAVPPRVEPHHRPRRLVAFHHA
jgi:hypothetical protein